MPHIMTILSAVIAVIALIVFSFQQEEVPAALLKPEAVSSTKQEAPLPINQSSEQTALQTNTQQNSTISSATALAYYKQAKEQGYVSLVSAFESGAIANSDMSTQEQEKLCEMTLTMVRVAEITRLENAGCAAKNGKVSFMSVNNGLKTTDGQIDQAAIIEKLDYFHQRNELQTDVTYKAFGIEEKDSLYNRAVAFNLDQVVDYLMRIQAPLPESNLINDHLRGRQPSLAMIKKLQSLGYSLDEQSQKIIQTERFQEKHPALSQQLAQH